MKKRKVVALLNKAAAVLSTIPAKRWCAGRFSDRFGRCCAVEHLRRSRTVTERQVTAVSTALIRTTGRSLIGHNDNLLARPYKTPRTRVLAGLRKAIKLLSA